MPWAAAAAAAAAIGGAYMQSESADKASAAQTGATNNAIAANDRQFSLTRSDLAPYRAAGQNALGQLQAGLGLAPKNAPQYVDPNAPLTPGIIQALYQHYLGRSADPSEVAWQMNNTPNAQAFEQGMRAPGGGNGAFQARLDQGYKDPGYLFTYSQPTDTSAPGTDSGQPSDSPLLRRFTMEDFQNDPVTKASFDFGLSEGEKAVQRMFGARGLSRSGAAIKAATRFATDYTGTKAGESQQRFVADQSNMFNKLAAVSGIGQASTTTTGTLGASSAANDASMLTAEGNARGAAAIARGNAYGGAANNIGNNLMGQFTLDRIINRPTGTTTTPTTTPAGDYSGFSGG